MRSGSRNFLRSVGLAFAVLAVLVSAPATAQDFYDGKKITFVVGGDSGGGYDIYARAIARHLGKYIKGSPAIIVQNMPGAGSNKAAEFMFNAAPKDGTTIATVFPGAIMGPLLEAHVQTRFDPTKFEYLGTADSGTRVCATFHTSKTRTFADTQTRDTIVGASSGGGATRDYGYLLKTLAGARFNIVTGYKGTNDITLALERGEVDGLCGFDWSSLKAQKPDWIRDNKLNILLQVGLEPDKELSALGVPHIWKYVTGEGRQVAELVIAQQVFGRPYLAPPGTPADRVKILRDAIMATLQDKDFLAEADKAGMSILPRSGADVQEVVRRLYAAPKELVERARKSIQPPS